MYYAIFLDDFLNTKSLYAYKEVGRVGNAVIIQYNDEPQSEYVKLSKDEALSFMFIGHPKDVLDKTVRPDNNIYEILKDRSLKRVPQINKLGEILDNVVKYKYTLTDQDRDNASALKNKISKWIPFAE